MLAKIMGISQELVFDNGETTNFMTLQLPNGEYIRTLIDDESTAKITALFIKAGGPAAEKATAAARSVPEVAVDAEVILSRQPSQEMPQDRQYTPLAMLDNGDMEFGGDHGEVKAAAPSPAQVSPMTPVRPPVLHVAPKIANVVADAKGNPVYQGEGMVDNQDLTGGNVSGEEDVGQI